MEASLDAALLRPGFHLDRYELLCPLAYGGMAAVWLARFRGKLGFEKLVVVKTILPQFAAEPEFQKMFVDEARIAAGIDHGNVARILDVGEQNEVLYIVMEWIDGESLSRLKRAVEKRDAKVPAGILLRILADTCAGLHAAHELRDKSGNHLGVVHRDVSPQNILLSAQGTAKLIDFGVAKARDRSSANTGTGQLKGKIRYMSPEQALGGDVDRRADLWSLGALAYELFAGAPPFDGPNDVVTLRRLTSGERPEPLRDVAAPIEAIISSALSFDPADRFATAGEMQSAFEGAMADLHGGTSAGDVSAFLTRYVGDRADARKRTVDRALTAAAERGRQGAGFAEEARRPTSPSTPGLSPLPERPSHASTATLGSAAVEWPTSESVPGRSRSLASLAIAGVIVGVSTIALGAFGVHRLVAARSVAPSGTRNDSPQTAPLPPTDTAFLIPEPVAAPVPKASASASAVSAKPEPPPRSAPRERAHAVPPVMPSAPAATQKKRDYGF